jgi:AraC family transcriptional regulator
VRTIDGPFIGCGSAATPTPLLLPPAANGYRRSLYPGRGVSVYYDRHPCNEWGEHTHEQLQVSVLLEPVGCTLKRKTPDTSWHELVVEGPAVWVMPTGMPHALVCPQQADMVTLFMEPAFVLATINRDVTEFTVIPHAQLASRDTRIGQLSKTFRQLCRGDAHGIPLFIEANGTVLGTHILQVLFGGGEPRRRRGGLPDEALRRVLRHIDEHLVEPIRLDDLAVVAGVCRSHFTELFKRSVDLTAHDYLMRRRVAKAQELIETTDKKKLEIAGLCGFSDDTMMARWFRRVLECTPREVRPRRPG